MFQRIFLFVIITMFAIMPTQARWKAEYAQTDENIQKWFKGLRSKQIYPSTCCDVADGKEPNKDDIQWDIIQDKYRVYLEGDWREVPEQAVIHEPNRFGRAVVWYYPNFDEAGKVVSVTIRCFLPGTLG